SDRAPTTVPDLRNTCTPTGGRHASLANGSITVTAPMTSTTARPPTTTNHGSPACEAEPVGCRHRCVAAIHSRSRVPGASTMGLSDGRDANQIQGTASDATTSTIEISGTVTNAGATTAPQ